MLGIGAGLFVSRPLSVTIGRKLCFTLPSAAATLPVLPMSTSMVGYL